MASPCPQRVGVLKGTRTNRLKQKPLVTSEILVSSRESLSEIGAAKVANRCSMRNGDAACVA
jgi:hypothetical protein